MSWLDDDASAIERKRIDAEALRKRNATIAEQAEDTYNRLWHEIVTRVREAKEKRLANLETNGNPFARVIVMPFGSNPRLSATVRLGEEKLDIVAEGLEPRLVFALDLGDDQVVHLNNGNQKITIQEAAKLILRPLIFPMEFPQK